jgi:pteridine reductase
MQSRAILVTGGARRIGAEISRVLHAAGCSVVVHCNRSLAEADALAAELNAERADSAEVVQGDLRDAGDLAALVERAARSFGRLDGLVNNASSFYPTGLDAITEASWDDLVGTNLRAPLFLAQAAAPHLRRTRGAIVNIVDIHAERPLKGFVVYTVAKAGLAGLTRSLALELAPAVRVNGVAPGAILWPEGGDQYSKEERARIVRQTPLQREGTPGDIAGAVKYLLLDAPYVTGQILSVDGGREITL